MSGKKIKIPKKELQKARKVEELAQVPVLSKEWLEEHSIKILAGVGTLLLLLGVMWAFNAYTSSKDQRACLEYAKVLHKWPADQNATLEAWQQMIPALETYLREFSGSAPANNAELDLARVYFQTQQYDKALKTTRQILDQQAHEQSYKFLAQYQLALIYEALGNTDEALTQWQALTTKEASGLSKEALWNMSRLYARKGDRAKAAEYCELALKAPGAYPNTGLIQSELASLKLESSQPASGQ